MTLKELELFFALSENPHISHLAIERKISQSAISLAIKSLEKKLEERLFDRVGKRLVLNERGRIFKQQTYESFLLLQNANHIFKKDRLRGELHIACSKTIADFIMPSIIYDFGELYPKITIKNEIKNSSQILTFLKEGSLDIGFIEAEYEHKDIIKEELADDELMVVSSDKTLEKETFIDELFEKNWILREEGSGTREIFVAALEAHIKSLHVKMQFHDFEEIKTLLKHDKKAISCLSKQAVKNELAQRVLVHVPIKQIRFKRKFYCAYHKNKYKSEVFELFKEFVAQKMSLLS
jgi:DNA-binding transcriptional LysR family regulator